MKNFIKGVSSYLRERDELKDLPDANLKLCYSNSQGYFTSIFFTKAYITSQEMEVICESMCETNL